MQAIGFNGVEFIEFEKETDSPLAHDLLVEIRAISINPIDTKVKQTVINKQTLVVHAAEDSAWYLSILLTNVNHKIMIKNLSIACNRRKLFDDVKYYDMAIHVCTALN